jgi:hypothetical protein
MKTVNWVSVSFLALCLVQCGQEPLAKRRFPLGFIDDLPEQMGIESQWVAPPELQIRDFGTSRMVSFRGSALGLLLPEIDRLPEAIQLEDRKSAEWLSPPLKGCELSQISVEKSASRPLKMEVTFWGWEKKSTWGKCEQAFEAGRKTGIRIALQGVPVKSTPAIPLVELQVR